MHTGDPAFNTVDSLSAFWPGLQVLAGDVQNAIKLHMMCKSFPVLTSEVDQYHLFLQTIIYGGNIQVSPKYTIQITKRRPPINIH